VGGVSCFPTAGGEKAEQQAVLLGRRCQAFPGKAPIAGTRFNGEAKRYQNARLFGSSRR